MGIKVAEYANSQLLEEAKSSVSGSDQEEQEPGMAARLQDMLKDSIGRRVTLQQKVKQRHEKAVKTYSKLRKRVTS